MTSPLISIMLCVRNGMPYVQDAVDSLRGLTYPYYELVVQDGASTDGTLEYLQGLTGFPRFSLVSEPDSGIGQAFNRALRRCQGELVGSVDSDNRLQADALDIIVREFAQHPTAAAVYGGCNMIDADGALIHEWLPPAFNLLGLLDGDVVPPFATSFFSRAQCGADLRFDETMPTVADFDLWLRLAHLPIVRIFDILADVRVGSQSSTQNPGMYALHSRFKIEALQRYLNGPRGEDVLKLLATRAESGIYLWAAESLGYIGADEQQVDEYFAKAIAGDIRSERFRRVVTAIHPRRPRDREDLEVELMACGIEYLKQNNPQVALVYFELLHSWSAGGVALQEWMAKARQVRKEALRITCDDLIQECMAEVARRDRLLAEQTVDHHTEIGRREDEIRQRDRLLIDLQAERAEAVDVRDRALSELNERLTSLKLKADGSLGEMVKRAWRRLTGN
jgi:glycosyltransferase involved in cell wall biosynthesis